MRENSDDSGGSGIFEERSRLEADFSAALFTKA
jgi:hypothetical protein